jgi:hypothetical protein
MGSARGSGGEPELSGQHSQAQGAARCEEPNHREQDQKALLYQSAAALGSFACGIDAGVRAVLDSGVLPHLLKMLQNGDSKVPSSAPSFVSLCVLVEVVRDGRVDIVYIIHFSVVGELCTHRLPSGLPILCYPGCGNLCTRAEDDFSLTIGSEERHVSRASYGASTTAPQSRE